MKIQWKLSLAFAEVRNAFTYPFIVLGARKLVAGKLIIHCESVN